MSAQIPFASSLPRGLLTAVLFLAAAGGAMAQFGIQVSLDRKLFLAQENIIANVTLSNTSGSDVVMGGRGSNWLQFQITDANERELSPVGVEVEEPFLFKAGQTMKRRIMLSDTHQISEPGSYGLKAIVYHPPTQDYYQSNRVRLTVTEVKPIWQQSYGVPQGFEDAGRVRVYSLHILRDDSGSRLYCRVTDDRSQLTLTTYSLGPINQAIDPAFSLDRENRLQAFFLAGPRIYAHCVVGPDGHLTSRKYFRETNDNRPVLASRGGEVFVVGGIPFDPTAPPPTSAEGGARRASERPPGL
jgi:hypothetical protein